MRTAQRAPPRPSPQSLPVPAFRLWMLLINCYFHSFQPESHYLNFSPLSILYMKRTCICFEATLLQCIYKSLQRRGKKIKLELSFFFFFTEINYFLVPLPQPPSQTPYAFKILQRLVKKLNGIWHLQKKKKIKRRKKK